METRGREFEPEGVQKSWKEWRQIDEKSGDPCLKKQANKSSYSIPILSISSSLPRFSYVIRTDFFIVNTQGPIRHSKPHQHNNASIMAPYHWKLWLHDMCTARKGFWCIFILCYVLGNDELFGHHSLCWDHFASDHAPYQPHPWPFPEWGLESSKTIHISERLFFATSMWGSTSKW